MPVSKPIARFALTAVLTAVAVPALAGPIILENNAAPNVCEVQVTTGPDAPNGPTQNFGDLEFNWRQEFDTDKLCWRVSEPPTDCSGTYSDWRCCESSGGESLCSIE